MKLYTLGVPYARISSDVLKLSSRVAMLQALKLYQGAYAPYALQRGTAYTRRVEREAIAELFQFGIASPDTNGTPGASPVAPHKIVEVPTQLPWDTFTHAELKTLISLYADARHSRAPYFTWEGRIADLAEIANLNRKAVSKALQTLASKGYLSTKPVRENGQRTLSGTRIALLDHESGASLNDRAWFFRNRLDELDVLTRYRLALAPQFDFVNGFTADSGVMLSCPFCLNHKRTLRVTSTETDDKWHCFACRKTGDSVSLCALKSFSLWKQPEFNMSQIAALVGAAPDRTASIGDLDLAS